jgi:hypothetical protein
MKTTHDNGSLANHFAALSSQFPVRVTVSDDLGITVPATLPVNEGDGLSRIHAFRLARDIAANNVANFKLKADKARKDGKTESDIAEMAKAAVNAVPDSNPVYSLFDLAADRLVAEIAKLQGVAEGTPESRVKSVNALVNAPGLFEAFPKAETKSGVKMPESFVASTYGAHIQRHVDAILAETFKPTKRGGSKADATTSGPELEF